MISPAQSSANEPLPVVSICTVSTPAHTALLSINHALTQTLNPRANADWVVTDNRDLHLDRKKTAQFLPVPHRKRAVHDDEVARRGREAYRQAFYDSRNLHADLPNARILEGPTIEQVTKRAAALSGLGDNPTPAQKVRVDKMLGSYHHAFGLDVAFAGVTTRYAIAMDPDFYVVRPDWITDVLRHMRTENVAVFGAPWNPRWYQKFRYFPCTHFLVLDLTQVPWREEIFSPDLIAHPPRYVSKFWRSDPMRREAGLVSRLLHLARNWKTAVSEDRQQRRAIGANRDTGYRLFEEFANGRNGLKADMLNPVLDRREPFIPDAISGFQRNAVLESLLPDRLSYIPKRRGYVARTGFREHGFPDFRSLGWEEFMWKGEPFAFHVRGELQRRSVGSRIDDTVAKGLDSVLSRLGRAPLARA